MKRLTIENIKNRCYEIYGYEYIIISNTYLKSSSKIEVFHSKCSNSWFITANNFLNKLRKCPSCYGNKKLTINDIKKRCFDLHGDKYSIISDSYINNSTKILVKHNECLHEWYVTSSDFLNNVNRCPSCAKNKKLTKEYVASRFSEHGYQLLSSYKNVETKVDVRHDLCGYLYKIRPYNFFYGKRCPICSRKKILGTKGEQEIEKFLIENNIKYEKQYIFNNCKLKNNLFYDFYLPELNICIEYDGIQHFESIDYFGGYEFLEKQKMRDNQKNLYCYNNNILLIRISYLEFRQISEILTNKLNR